MPSIPVEIDALVAEVAGTLSARGLTLATAESCTGGWIAKAVTDRPGASTWFLGAVVSYADAIKTDLLGVDAALLRAHGAVSEPVVLAMAQGVRAVTGADLAIATSGVAGPDGGSPDKPVGTVWVAWASADAARTRRLQLDGDRGQIRAASVVQALRGLIELLA